MKYKNESALNLVQGDLYKENDFYSSPDSLKDQMDLKCSTHYENEYFYQNEQNQPNKSNEKFNFLEEHNNSSLNQQSVNSTLVLKANNSFISSSNFVTSTTYFTNRIPLPNELEASSSTFDNESLIRLRNMRERNRVRNVNDGFDRLRKHLPNQLEFKKDKRLSKVQTLKLAINYIKQLETILNSTPNGKF